jgi:hypothetical protein
MIETFMYTEWKHTQMRRENILLFRFICRYVFRLLEDDSEIVAGADENKIRVFCIIFACFLLLRGVLCSSYLPFVPWSRHTERFAFPRRLTRV